MENTAPFCPVAVKCLVPALRWPQLHCCGATSHGRPARTRRAPTHRRNPRPAQGLGTLEVSAVGLGGDPDWWGTSARRSAGLFGHRRAPEALNVPKLLCCKRFSQTGKVSPRIDWNRNDNEQAGEVPINTRSV